MEDASDGCALFLDEEKIMSNVDVNDPQGLHDLLTEAHRKFYAAEPNEQLMPTVILYTPDGVGTAVTFLISGDERQKEGICALLKEKISDDNVVMYAFFAEAWAASYDRGKVDKAPFKREDKKEVVTTTVIHRDGRKVCSLMEINRDWVTGFAVLGEVDAVGGEFGGRFAELFETD
jgi:hypothetical protein